MDAVYVSSCDVPFLAPAFVRRMIELLGDHVIAVPDVGGRHPLAAVYRVEVLPVVERLLAAERVRMMDLFDEVPTRFVKEGELAPADPGLRTLKNVNTVEEYESALREGN
jgi:molybdopterin-guanine dinucleotide biosynthesis protein A